MLDVSQIDTLLGIGVVAALFAIAGGVRGVYSVSATSRRERSNQTTTTFHLSGHARKRTQAAEKRRAA